MSASLIRKGLQLLGDDVKDVSKKRKRRRRKNQEAMELLSTNRRGVTKQLNRLQGRHGNGKSKATLKDKRTRSAVEEFRKKKGTSHLRENLQYFMKHAIQATNADTMKILHQHSGRQSRNRPVTAAPKAQKEAPSLFTEDEFQLFQEEYFGRTVENK